VKTYGAFLALILAFTLHGGWSLQKTGKKPKIRLNPLNLIAKTY
jgi:hypothetical protein